MDETQVGEVRSDNLARAMLQAEGVMVEGGRYVLSEARIVAALHEAEGRERERCAKALCRFCAGDNERVETGVELLGRNWVHWRHDRTAHVHCPLGALWNLEDGK